MRRSRQLVRYIRDGFRNICSNLFMSVSSVLTLTITLSLCALFVLFAENTNQLTRQVESEVKILVGFEMDLPEDVLEDAVETILNKEYVEDGDFRTSEEELEEAAGWMGGGDAVLTAALIATQSENPLPPTLIVEASSIDHLTELSESLEEMDEVNFVTAGDECSINTLINVTTTIRTAMIVIVIVLMIVAVFLIQNTIKLTIFARQEELKIMKLVGASIPHVTVPFVVEGLVIGVLGAVIPILLTMFGYTILFDASGGALGVPFLQMAAPDPLVYQIGFVVGLIAIGVSLLGSLFAVAKYALKD